MKLVIGAMVLFFAQIATSQHAIPTKATFVVRDDMGSPVTNALVDGGFGDVSQSGARDRFDGFTDTNGIFVATGNAVLNVGARFRKQGYYQTINIAPVDGKQKKTMKRWDVTIPVLLKPIKNPIPMSLKLVENPHVDFWERVGQYRLGCTSRYDIVKGDFLPPYGKGELGILEFKWKMDIHSKDKYGIAVDYDTQCEISMPNSVDGLCQGTPSGAEDAQSGSSYISDYEAPLEGYTKVFSFCRTVRGTKAETNDDKHYLYYFRIRTQTNEMGQVTSALYGKIYGHINGTFSYYLNPTPNDRNVEFDPKRNLFKDNVRK